MSEEGYEMEYIKEAFETNWIAPCGKNVTENLFQNGVCLPSDTKMTDEDLHRVVKIIEERWCVSSVL